MEKKKKANDRLADTTEENVHSMGKILHQNAISKQMDDPKQEKDKIKLGQCNKQQKNSFHHRPVNGIENKKNRPERQESKDSTSEHSAWDP